MLLRIGVVPHTVIEPIEALTVFALAPDTPPDEERPLPPPNYNAGGSSERTEERRKPLEIAQAAPKASGKTETVFKTTPTEVLDDASKIASDTSLIDSIGKASIGNREAGSGSGNPGRGIGNGTGDGIGDGFGPGFQIEPARWVRVMNYYQLRRFYPKPALEAKTSGVVDLVCYVKLNRRVSRCYVESETPAGKGFGAASLRASKKFRIFPREIDGEPIDRAPVSVRIYYDPEPLNRYAERQ
ncbi:MAG: hypothetical protein AAGH53_06320 [Pseudomonadota bacterium]